MYHGPHMGVVANFLVAREVYYRLSEKWANFAEKGTLLHYPIGRSPTAGLANFIQVPARTLENEEAYASQVLGTTCSSLTSKGPQPVPPPAKN